MNKALRKELAFLIGGASLISLLVGRKRTAAGLGFAGSLMWLSSRVTPRESWVGQTVMITGGSRGLGLALAMELIKEGARVSLLARDEQELRRARMRLRLLDPKAQVLLCVCDVTEPEQLQAAFERTRDEWDSIDMIINDAGAILVGPFESMSRADFDAQMELHLHAVIESVRLVLPHFRSRGGGRIVNICSMGGKVAVPHMLPYDTSKFALAGFSQGISAELAKDDIQVTTVYPTLMRTGSPIQAVFKGDPEKEYAWFSPADNLPGLSLSPEVAARRILRAVRDGRTEVILSVLGKARLAAGVFFPELMMATMRFLDFLMPREQSSERRTGALSRARLQNAWWSWPFSAWARQAEVKWNQKPKTDARFNAGIKNIPNGPSPAR